MPGPDVRAIQSGSLPEAPFPGVRHEYRIRIAEEAFDRVVARGGEDTTREVGGVLVGRIARDAAGPHLLVEATIDALHAEEKGTELTFTHATWDHIHREKDARFPEAKIVGWYHTHPGFGIFLSDRDAFIQKSFFDLPFQVALVYDPKSREHGVFAWRDGEPVRWRRYWVGDREQTWDGARAPAGAAKPPMTAGAAAQGGTMPTGASGTGDVLEGDRWTLALGALVLLLLGGAVGWWLGRGRGPGDVPAQAARAQGAEDLARQVNVQIVSLLRQVLVDAPVRRSLEDARAALDEGLKALPEGAAPPKAALERLAAGRDALVRLLATHEVALANVRTLEDEAARLQPIDARALADALSLQRAVLGRVCAELAAAAGKAGDAEGAKSWLILADRVDPQSAEARRRAAPGGGGGGGR